MKRFFLCAALALAAMALLPASGALAASDPFDFSAGDQYVETVPTSKGPALTENAPKRRSSTLRKQTRKALAKHGGADAATLAAVAESPQLGAPQTTPAEPASDGDSTRSKSHAAGRERHGAATPEGSRSVPSAAINAASESGSGLGWLVLGLPLITAVALGIFGIQRRRDQDKP